MKGIVSGSRLYVFAIRRFDEHSWVTMLLSLLLCDEGAHSAAGHDSSHINGKIKSESIRKSPFSGVQLFIYAVNQSGSSSDVSGRLKRQLLPRRCRQHVVKQSTRAIAF